MIRFVAHRCPRGDPRFRCHSRRLVVPVIRALAAGLAAGLTLSALIAWAFAKGCPMFDPILDSDTIHHI